MASADTPVEDLLNIGPYSARCLREIGITNRQQLEKTGATDAYHQVRLLNGPVSLNLLYALHGALLGVKWDELPNEMRSQLAAEAAQSH